MSMLKNKPKYTKIRRKRQPPTHTCQICSKKRYSLIRMNDTWGCAHCKKKEE